MMEIEKNREDQIRKWESDVSELGKKVTAWVKEGESRPELVGSLLQLRLALLEDALKFAETRFRRDDEDHPHLKRQTEVIPYLQGRIQLLTYWVGMKLEKFRESEEASGAVVGELQSSAASEALIETSPEHPEVAEGDESMEGLNKENEGELESDAEEEDELVTDGSETTLNRGDVLQIGVFTREETNEKVGEEKIKAVENGDFWLRREEIAMEFEKMMTIAASKVQSTDAVWILGLIEDQKFEPIFLLVREHLGPPPWVRGAKGASIEDKLQVRAWLVATMTDEKVAWKDLESWKDGDGIRFRVPSPKSCLGLENQTGSFHFWKEKVSAYNKFGPNIQKLGPPPWPGTLLNNMGPDSSQINDGHKGENERQFNDNLHLRLESSASQTPGQSLDSPLPPPGKPPPDKPPPQPPDFISNFSKINPNFSKLSPIPTASIFCSNSYPNPIQINGKVDAAGHDPGNSQFFELPSSFDFNWDFTHSLVDKANFKGSVRAIITKGEGNECSFVLPIPPEPPPHPWVNLGSVFPLSSKAGDYAPWQLSGRRKSDIDDPGLDTMQIDGKLTIGQLVCEADNCLVEPRNKPGVEWNTGANQMVDLFYHGPRPPEFADCCFCLPTGKVAYH